MLRASAATVSANVATSPMRYWNSSLVWPDHEACRLARSARRSAAVAWIVCDVVCQTSASASTLGGEPSVSSR